MSAIITVGRPAFALERAALCSQFLRQRARYGGVFAAELLLRSILHSLLPLAFLCPQ